MNGIVEAIYVNSNVTVSGNIRVFAKFVLVELTNLTNILSNIFSVKIPVSVICK